MKMNRRHSLTYSHPRIVSRQSVLGETFLRMDGNSDAVTSFIQMRRAQAN